MRTIVYKYEDEEKTTAMVEIKKEDILGITLLPVEEADKVPKYILESGKYWRLRSSCDNPHKAMAVKTTGSIDYDGDIVYSCVAAVRPVLIVNNFKSFLKDHKLKIGDSVRVFDRDWIIISDTMILLKGKIGSRKFDEKSNDYGISDIKRYIENWLNVQLNLVKAHVSEHEKLVTHAVLKLLLENYNFISDTSNLRQDIALRFIDDIMTHMSQSDSAKWEVRKKESAKSN